MSVGAVTGKAWTDGQPPPVTAADLLTIEQAIVDAAQSGGGGDGSARIEGFHGIRTSDPPNPPANEAYQHWYIRVQS